jgi:hypothetical protein
VSDEYVKLSRFPGSNEDPESILCEKCSFADLMLDKDRVKEEDGWFVPLSLFTTDEKK